MQLSLLDAFEHGAGGHSVRTLQESLAWARAAEAMGVHRYWIVEHHNVAFEACPAPEVMVAALAAATTRLRVGTGGILLNNYSPYKVAELGRTLTALYGDRIDLGVGRSISGAGPDLALQRLRGSDPGDDQAAQVTELVQWLSGRNGAAVGSERTTLPTGHRGFADMAIMPDMAATPQAWVLAGSAKTAALAGSLGLSLACSGFHRPELIPEITAAYRAAFRPADRADAPQSPQIMVALMGAVADTAEEAALQFLPMRWTNELRRTGAGVLTHLPSPDEALAAYGGQMPGPSPLSDRFTVCAAATLRARMERMREEHGVTEILFRPGIAGLPEKLAMTACLMRAVGEL